MDWIKRNKDNILWGAVLVVLAAAFFAYKNRERLFREPGQWEYMQGVYAFSQGDTTQALNILDELVAKHPGSRWAKRALYYIGYHYYEQGNYELAEEYWTRFLKSKPKDPFLEANAKAGLAAIKADAEAYEEAAKLLTEAYKETPYQTYKGFFLYRKGSCLLLAGDTAEALKAYKEVSEAFEETPPAGEAEKMVKLLGG